MKRVVTYSRVSSKEQAEGFSIGAQTDLLREYALKNDFKIEKEFIESETAKKGGREIFNLMVEMVRNGKVKGHKKIDAILVEKTDRLYRNFTDWVNLNYEEMGIEIHLVKENEILSSESKSHQKFIHGIKVLMAKNFIDNLSEETKKGMYKKLESGGYPFMAPMGYKNDPISHDIVIDEEYSQYVKKAFEYFSTGQLSLAGLTQKLFDEGLRGKRSKKRQSKEAIKRILTNPFYLGKMKVKGKVYQGNHEPLISKELFEIVQAHVTSRRKPQAGGKDFPFIGMMKCDHCGCAVTAEEKRKKSGKTYIYYHCTNFKRNCDGVVYLREEKVDLLFAEAVKKLSIPEEVIELTRKALLESHKDEKEYHHNALTRLNREFERFQNMIDACYEDKLTGKVSEDFWERQTGTWKKKQDDVLSSISFHKQANTKYLKNGIELLELARNAHGLYLKQPLSEKRKFLNIVLSNPRIKNGSIEYDWKKPFDLMVECNQKKKWGD